LAFVADVLGNRSELLAQLHERVPIRSRSWRQDHVAGAFVAPDIDITRAVEAELRRQLKAWLSRAIDAVTSGI